MKEAILAAIALTTAVVVLAQAGEPARTGGYPGDTIVDTLGEASPLTTFAVDGGWAGERIRPDLRKGPQFVLTRRTQVIEIGAFVGCPALGGIEQCPEPTPIHVTIHGTSGPFDLTPPIATYTLTDDVNTELFSYEFVLVDDLTLEPGTYYALFWPLRNPSFLLSEASDPFPYVAERSTFGFFDLFPPGGFLVRERALAVRILGVSMLAVQIDVKPSGFPNSINPNSRGVVPVAILGSDTFDVADVDITTLVFGPGGAGPAHNLSDSFTHKDHMQDVNLDGFTDLVTHYRTTLTGIKCGDGSATLTGSTMNGRPFEGLDTIRTVGCVRRSKHLSGG